MPLRQNSFGPVFIGLSTRWKQLLRASPAPSGGAAWGTVTSCDLVNNGQRGFSVETSKLEAVYFQPGFWGNRHQHLSAWPGVHLPPHSKLVLEKGTPEMFSDRFSDSGEDRSRPEDYLPEGRQVCGTDQTATICPTRARRNVVKLPRPARARGPAQLGHNEHGWPSPQILTMTIVAFKKQKQKPNKYMF